MSVINGLFTVGKADSIRFNDNNGKPVLNFSVADRNTRYDENDARRGKHPKAVWYEVTLWNKMAEMYGPNGSMPLAQGEQLYLAGEAGVEAMLDKEGQPLTMSYTTPSGERTINREKNVIANVHVVRKVGSRQQAEATVGQAPAQKSEAKEPAPKQSAAFEEEIPF